MQLQMDVDKLHEMRGWKMEKVRQKWRRWEGLREKVAGEKEVAERNYREHKNIALYSFKVFPKVTCDLSNWGS